MYWMTNKDGAGQSSPERTTTSCTSPPGGLPPNNAFWSLTMGDAHNHFVPNRSGGIAKRSSGLVQDADGSVDIYIQNAAPAGHESNWLPAPSDNFILWLRVSARQNHSRWAVQCDTSRPNAMTSPMKHKHLITFGSVMSVAWVIGTFLFVYYWPHLAALSIAKLIRRACSSSLPPGAFASAARFGVVTATFGRCSRFFPSRGPELQAFPNIFRLFHCFPK